ncbi:5-histidylcysteine sulfoxide synthase [Glaciimonas immobilis]|nr:5-histidylcysteine sulfoxide synthase [Glaciimonas immobilis]KAF3998239.1 5-histidylcysteine sulfoxide synthase [Glaciimonas immobilis]
MLTGDDPQQKRREILDYFIRTYDLYESLFDCLGDERAYYNKAIPLRHPLIFYLGHTAAFFINKLLASRLIDKRINDKIEAMVAIGVDEMSWDDMDNSRYDWPSVQSMQAYRDQVRARVIDFIQNMRIDLPVSWDSPAWIIMMGIEHERIHLETSSVLIRQLPIEWVQPQPHWPVCSQARCQREDVPENSLIDIKGERVRQGKNDATYGWDNEYGIEFKDVESFKAGRMVVSNAEYFEFVQTGGYHNPRWWDDEGWAWREFSAAEMPTFWIGSGSCPDFLKLRLMSEELPMPWDWPAEVNQLEASAFCRWKSSKTGTSLQLLCEAEWYLLRKQVQGDQSDWQDAPGNINLTKWASPCPVDTFAQGDFFDIVGNVWQWTTTPINSFEGFRVHPLYDDFSVPTFDSKHFLVKGGSWISTGNEAIKSSRYAFRRHFFQHSGFRYALSSYKETIMVNPYETDAMVVQYLDFQYGAVCFNVQNYAKQLVEIATSLCNGRQRALDMGCATGRASFELARYFEQVVGMDYSARFIDVAQQFANSGYFRYAFPTEGDLLEYCEIRLSDSDLGPKQAERIKFVQGDACNLKPQGDLYDLVLAANLIDRLHEPKQFLQSITTMIRSGGILLLSSPYTWFEECTPKNNWLGGFHENGEALTTYQALQRLLADNFEEACPSQDIAFVIRETARKHQHTVAHVTAWRKR